MKKILVLIMAFALIFCVTTLTFAATEFQMIGVVTKISGNKITIMDDTGNTTTVENNAVGIKVGDSVRSKLTGQISKTASARTELTTQDADFLTEQCLIDQADVNVISKLKEETRVQLYSLTAKRNCKLLEPFKVSREYVKQYTPPPK